MSCVIVVDDPEVLQQRVAALEQERAEFMKLKQQLEAEFNQKRAKFKELYMTREGTHPIIARDEVLRSVSVSSCTC